MRTKNVTERRSCDYCLDTGYVVVEGPDGKGYDEVLGPCPFCEKGYAEEFPDLSKSTSVRPKWGEDGYWKGRDTSFLIPQRTQHFTLTPEDQRMYLRAALKSLGMNDLLTTVDEEIAPTGRDDDVREVLGGNELSDNEHIQHTDDLPEVQTGRNGPPTLL